MSPIKKCSRPDPGDEAVVYWLRCTGTAAPKRARLKPTSLGQKKSTALESKSSLRNSLNEVRSYENSVFYFGICWYSGLAQMSILFLS
jgi:hypothetical protein